MSTTGTHLDCVIVIEMHAEAHVHTGVDRKCFKFKKKKLQGLPFQKDAAIATPHTPHRKKKKKKTERLFIN